MLQHRPSGFKILPDVVKNIIIINGIMFLATISLATSFNLDLVDLLGLHYPAAEKFNPYQFITYMFMHGGFAHIFFNMFAVWMFGSVLENVWGGKKFLIFYVITGIGAALTHYIIFYFEIKPVLEAVNACISNPSNNALVEFFSSSTFMMPDEDTQHLFHQFRNNYNATVNINENQALQLGIDFLQQYKVHLLNAPVVVGASGAVFGILLAFGMMFPNTLIYIYFAIPIKAKYFVILYGVLELISGIADVQGDNTAHFAHLGGMVFGFILIKMWQKKKKNPYID